MFGTRCAECGEVRWSILGRNEDEPGECPACGATMTVERRRPGRQPDAAADERRAAAAVTRG